MIGEVGNDVVDLDEARAPPPRLLERALCAEERALQRRDENPGPFYWQLWAAKETAYKALARQEPGLIFSPAAFRVRPAGNARAQVQHAAGAVEVRWSWRGGALACAGMRGAWAEDALSCCTEPIDAATQLHIGLTDLELESVHSDESRAARLLAKRLCGERLGVATSRLQIVRPAAATDPARAQAPRVRRGAPEVWLDDARLEGVHLSLSHDGRFASCALGA